MVYVLNDDKKWIVMYMSYTLLSLFYHHLRVPLSGHRLAGGLLQVHLAARHLAHGMNIVIKMISHSHGIYYGLLWFNMVL